MKIKIIFWLLVTSLLAACAPMSAKPQVQMRLSAQEWTSPTEDFNAEAQTSLKNWLNELMTNNINIKNTQFKLDSKHQSFVAIQEILRMQGAQKNNVSVLPEKHLGKKKAFVAALVMQRHVNDCPSWKVANMSDSIASQTSNFGCATTRNLAQIVADPKDLIRGKPLKGATAEHSVNALDRYYRRAEEQQLFQTAQEPEPLLPPQVTEQ